MKTTVFVAVMLVGISYAVAVNYFFEVCNENRCVSRVSKCQLTGACGCTLENCTCCVNCTLCLAELWDDCCACVSMCKPRNRSAADPASFSTIADLSSGRNWPADSLFRAFTSGKPTPDAHWTVDHVTPEEEGVNLEAVAPAAVPARRGGGSPDRTTTLDASQPESTEATAPALLNETTITESTCTVAYVKICLGLEKCADACGHMGAARYRWFHTGCCECVGHSCLSYGKNKALCSECPND